MVKDLVKIMVRKRRASERSKRKVVKTREEI